MLDALWYWMWRTAFSVCSRIERLFKASADKASLWSYRARTRFTVTITRWKVTVGEIFESTQPPSPLHLHLFTESFSMAPSNHPRTILPLSRCTILLGLWRNCCSSDNKMSNIKPFPNALCDTCSIIGVATCVLCLLRPSAHRSP